MGSMARAYRERQICIDEMRRKYPGLPYYEKYNTEIYRTIAFGPIYDSSTCPLSPYEPPKEDSLRKAEELESIYRANSKLSSLMGYFLDFLYTKEEAEYYMENLEEFINLNAIYKGSMHTIGYIASSLFEQNYLNIHIEEGTRLGLKCWKKVMDTSEKYNPVMKEVSYFETVIPINKDKFLTALEKRLMTQKVNQ